MRDRWWKTAFIGGKDEKMEAAAKADASDYLLQRVGSSEAMAFAEDLARRGKLAKLKGMVEFD